MYIISSVMSRFFVKHKNYDTIREESNESISSMNLDQEGDKKYLGLKNYQQIPEQLSSAAQVKSRE